ncbi:hypothetical protein NW757_001876 [Fusarium falciforme]|nr:hypothetical protein NW757_001876 [Fusarium falciforme]
MAHTPYLSTYTSSFSYAGGATRANIGGVRAKEHLLRALGEIDGLFVGMKYVDGTETSPPDTNQHEDLSGLDDLALELGAFSAAASIPPPIHQSAEEIAWSRVRDVRSGMQCHWRHFVKLSQSLNIPIINRLRATYEDAKGFREAGVFAFRNTLTGPAPRDLTKVFAFCSLSYVVSNLLHARGRLERAEILAGITLWLNALEVPEEREAFKTLAQSLWPEAHNHLHCQDLGLSARTQNAIVALQGNDFVPTCFPSAGLGSPGPVLEPGCDPAPLSSLQGCALPALGSSTTGHEVQDFPVLSMLAQEASQEHVYKLTNATYDAWNWGLLQPLSSDPPLTAISQPYHDTGEGQFINDPSHGQFVDPSLDVVPPSTTEQPATNSDLDIAWACVRSPEELHGTSLFIAVRQYFWDSRDFWYGLSGKGTITKDICSLLAWNQERARERERIHGQYLRHLMSEKDTKDVPSRGIVSIVESFVEMGYLQSIEEAKNYMREIGKASRHCSLVWCVPWANTFNLQSLFSDLAAYEKFVVWITDPT